MGRSKWFWIFLNWYDINDLIHLLALSVIQQAVEHVDPVPTDNLHPSQMGNKQILPNPMTTMPGGNNSMTQGMMSPMVMPPPQQMQQDMMGYHGNSSPMLQAIAPRPPPTLEPMVPTSEPMMMSQGYMNQVRTWIKVIWRNSSKS